MTTEQRWRWRLWRTASKLPRVCPANAHSLLIERRRRNPLQDDLCEPERGTCWCGKRRTNRCVMGSTVSPEEWCRRSAIPGELWCLEHAAEIDADAVSLPETRKP